jgi:tRNA threonylcarbamoyladenosine biosynthesis protein TsaB
MILALKTSDNHTGFWLYAGIEAAEPAAHTEWESGRELSEQLLGRLKDFVESHHTKLTGLSGVAIYTGPGSFTSLRIGHSVANALADSLGIPVVGATGEDWLATAQSALRSAKPGRPALPYYGADAHITRPKS